MLYKSNTYLFKGFLFSVFLFKQCSLIFYDSYVLILMQYHFLQK